MAATLAVSASAAARDPNQCLHTLKDKVTAASKLNRGGDWIDDGSALLEGGWEPGMSIKEVKYCMTKANKFGALMLVVGDEITTIELEKHGDAGKDATCKLWQLEENDYVRFIEYTWDKLSGNVISLVFQTYLGFTRVIGKGSGSRVAYEFSAFQPFVGFFSYEQDGKIKAFGAIEDDCHNTPTSLPFGVNEMSAPSKNELHGKEVTESLTWDNEMHGVAAEIDEKVLDEIEKFELENDSSINEIQKSGNKANESFVDVNVNVVVEDRVSKKEKPTRETEPVMLMQNELEVLRKELFKKDNMIANMATVERAVENTAEEVNDESDLAWSLMTVMTVLAIIMLAIIVCLCCYIKNIKN